MRRMLISIGLAGLLTLALAGTAFGAHCVNESKQAGSGQHVVVLIDPENPMCPPTFEGTNAAGRLTGGFADVYLDMDGSGTLSEGDIQVEDDVFLAANHSDHANPAQGTPAILPPILAGADPGGDGHGVGVNE